MRLVPKSFQNENKLEIINSLTPNAVQKAQNWRTPSEFPCCPQEKYENPITTYSKNLNVGGDTLI